MIRVFTNEEAFSSVCVRKVPYLVDKVILKGLGEALFTQNHIQYVLREKVKLPFSVGVDVVVSPATDIVGSYNRYDLPIALALLFDKAGLEIKDEILVLGELRGYKVTLKTYLDERASSLVDKALSSAFELGITSAIVPKELEDAVTVPEGMTVFFASSIQTAIVALQNFTRGKLKELTDRKELSDGITFPELSEYVLPLENITDDEEYATENMKFASVVAVAGKFNLMLYGAPGCKKTMVAQSMTTFLPKLSRTESMEVRRIYASAGAGLNMLASSRKGIRPFRMPHQTSSIEGICGGGPNCRPGEITLAHKGILFLDEAAEFKSSVLQMLRVPLEIKSISLSRAGHLKTYPADFQLVTTLNPCPCGNYGSKTKICLCSAKSVEMYWRKFSAPLIDRMDIKVYAGGENLSPEKDLTTDRARQLVKNAWEARAKRGDERAPVPLSDEARKIFADAELRYGWTGRAKASATRVAGVIADMYQKDMVTADMAELAVKLHGFSTPTPELS